VVKPPVDAGLAVGILAGILLIFLPEQDLVIPLRFRYWWHSGKSGIRLWLSLARPV
jgi:hypothetical protein